MQLAGEGLKRLTRLPSAWKALPATGHMMSTEALDQLAALAQSLSRGGLRGKTPIPQAEQHKRLMALWRNADGKLEAINRKDIRGLCQIPEIALESRFIRALAAHPQAGRSRAWADGILASYFNRWREMPDPEGVERAIKDLLDTYPAQASWLDPLRPGPWQAIGPEAAEVFASQLENPSEDLDSLLSAWGLSSERGLGRAVTEACLRAEVEELCGIRKGISEKEAKQWVEALFQHLFIRVPKGEAFDQSLERLILSEWAKRSPGLRELILNWCLAHPELGDPRRAPGWHPIPLARQALVSWMARRDLTFFYDSVVANHEDDQGRKAFWLRYLDAVQDFRLVLSDSDRTKLDARFRGRGLVSHMDGNTDVSAFLLRFKDDDRGDFICVEFSHTGHALFIYEADTFEDDIARMDAVSFRITPGPRNIKDTALATHRQVHAGDWQYKVGYYLKQRGVTPQ